MNQLIPFLIIIPLLIFYLWMFWAMATNDELPNNGPIRWPPSTKLERTILFIVFSTFAAIAYYVTEYRRKEP